MKSSIIFSAFVVSSDELKSILGFSEGSLPLKYLGCLVIDRELCSSDCEELIGKLQREK